MVTTASLATYGKRKYEGKKETNGAVVGKWFISCEQKCIWPVTNGLQKC
jgi:hypothetical protein